MKKYCAAALVIAVLLLGGCGQAASETNSDNILPGREVTAYAETSNSTAGDGEDEHTREQTEGQAQVSASALASQAAEAARYRIFGGCTIGIMTGGRETAYVTELVNELERLITEMGYSISTDSVSDTADVSILYAEGDITDAAALLTRPDIALIVCCDMESTEHVLFSDNEYRLIGTAISVVGMNETECTKIEHR